MPPSSSTSLVIAAGAGALAGAAAAAGVALTWRFCERSTKGHASLVAKEAAVLEKLKEVRVVPVLAVPDADSAVPLAEALVAGGLPVIEVVFRTAAAEDALWRMARAVPQAFVGAGTILSIAQAKKAVDAGAQFIVSPGLNPEVVTWCRKQGVPVIPGVATPTEVEAAMQLGLKFMKFFPAEANGGAAALKAICAPYAGLNFMPTGGVGEKNLETYLSIPQVVAVGGTWMVPADDVAKGDAARIKELSTKASSLAHSFGRKA